MVQAIDTASVFHLVYVLSFLTGSASIGYLVIRLAYAEIRMMDNSLKIGYSLIAGGGIVIIAFAADGFAGSTQSSGGGWFPLTLLATLALSFAVLRLITKMREPHVVQVGLPTVRNVQGIERNGLEQEFASVIHAVSQQESGDAQK